MPAAWYVRAAMDADDVAGRLRDPLRRKRADEILRDAAIELAVVYGSQARGEGRRDSDLDLGLLAADGRALSYRSMGALAVSLSSVFEIEVDVSDLSTPDAVFRYEVARCARPLFQARPDAFADFLAKAMIDHADIARFLPELIAGVARRTRRTRSPDPPAGGRQP